MSFFLRVHLPSNLALGIFLSGSVLLLSGTARSAFGQEVKTYSGEGTAILGTGMTMEETRQLALDAARRDALQKFGSYVRSEQTLQRTRSGNGTEEVFTSETQVISASVIRVVEGTKSVKRSSTEGETLRFTASATFEIDLSRFNRRVDRYQSASGDSELHDLVDRNLQIERELRDTESTEERQQLRRRSLALRQQINQSLQRIDGSRVQMNMMSERKRRREALERYVRFVRKNGYPYSLVEIAPRAKPKTVDEGKYVEISASYDLLHADVQQTKALGDTLRNLAKKWNSKGSSPADANEFFFDYLLLWVGTNRVGDVVFVGRRTLSDERASVEVDYVPRKGNYSDPYPIGTAPENRYTGPGERVRPKIIREDLHFNADVPHELFREVDQINLLISRFQNAQNLSDVLKDKGFEITGTPRKTAVNKGASALHVDEIVLSKSTFKDQIGKTAKMSEDEQVSRGEQKTPSKIEGLFVEAHSQVHEVKIKNIGNDRGKGIGVKVGYGFTSFFASYLGISRAHMDAENPITQSVVADKYTLVYVDLGGRLNLNSGSVPLVPYIDGSLVGTVSTYDTGAGDITVSGPGVSVGGGVQYFFSPTFALNGGFGLTFGSYNQVAGNSETETAGLSFTGARVDLGLSWYPFQSD